MKLKYFAIGILILLLSNLFFAQINPLEKTNLTETEKDALFDIFVDIPEEFHEVGDNNELFSIIRLVNLGGAGRIDVFLDYEILNEAEERVLKKRETLAVETQATIARSFDLKGDPVGIYSLFVTLTYADGKNVSSEHSFRIVPKTKFDTLFIVRGLIISLIIIFIGVLLYKSRYLIERLKIKFKIKKIVKDSKR